MDEAFAGEYLAGTEDGREAFGKKMQAEQEAMQKMLEAQNMMLEAKEKMLDAKVLLKKAMQTQTKAMMTIMQKVYGLDIKNDMDEPAGSDDI